MTITGQQSHAILGAAILAPSSEMIELGYVSGIHGVSGWLKLFSFTQPKTAIFEHKQLILHTETDFYQSQFITGRSQGPGIVACIEHCHDRDDARQLMGMRISILRKNLPKLASNEFYWLDLVGLQVVNLAHQVLGTVIEVQETGANDVLLVKGKHQYLIPYITDIVIKSVQPDQQIINVDWDESFLA